MLATLAFCPSAFCGQFVVFPKANALQSPDGRDEARNDVAHHATGDFTGMFNSLWLVEVATGQSRKLYAPGEARMGLQVREGCGLRDSLNIKL